MAIVLQGRDDQAKQSTRYLARGASAVACNTDLSQRFLNLSTNVSYCFEATTTRFNYSHPRTMGFRLSMDNTHSGLLWRHGAGANTETFGFSAANTLRIQVANAVIWTQALSILTGSTHTVVVTWRSRANPDAAGAGDAVLSRVDVWNVTAGTHEAFDVPAHVTKALSSATAVLGANTHPAGTPFSGTMTAFWFENRYQSAAEIANDWVSARSQPSSDVVNVDQGLPPTAELFDAANHRDGPSKLWAAHATRGLTRRTLSPFVNEVLRVQPTWTHSALTTADPFIRGAPDDGTWRMHLSWRRTVPVPHTCTHAWVRLHLRSWTSSGAAVPIGVRIYSMSRLLGMPLPPADQGAPDPLTSYYLQSVVTRDDDASAGEYTVLGLLPLARGRTGIMDGKTCFVPALKVDPAAASANDANARIMLRAMHIVPAFVQADGGVPWGEVGS
jgi:hypothetical protein